MKSIVLIFFLLILSATGAAQETCVIPSKNALALHNLRLEMSPEQVQSVVGRQLKIKIKKKGERTFFQNFIDKQRPPQTLPNVRAIYLRFFDGRLYQIEIFYENRSDLQTLAAFTEYLSASFNLPAANWQTEKERSEIKCAEVSLVADYVLNPRVEITDEATRARVEESRGDKK
jgi:hypothetical protein